ncbi:hypothetical protein WMW72_12325 [Paenibacillus filicis]|uniref:Uncharacterized protein n=1 Tax=Paenibacillus filicis TaxID=669464 RepID=A0ABU9DIJ9_9BACL
MNKYTEAIETIRNNYPPAHYTMLIVALDLAISVLKEKSEEQEDQP